MAGRLNFSEFNETDIIKKLSHSESIENLKNEEHKRGRKQKYATDEERHEARKQQQKAYRERKKKEKEEKKEKIKEFIK